MAAVASPILISVIVPALDEAGNIEATLMALQNIRSSGHEVIVVDGGSTDNTVQICQPLADRVLHAPAGRAVQMQAGAAAARGDILWFLHADTLVPEHPERMIINPADNRMWGWGYFRVRFPRSGLLLKLVAGLMNIRSRLTRIATGDQGIFVARNLFDRVNGFQQLPLMEDIALSKALKKHARPMCIPAKLTTSSRRWQQHGVVRTILLMWSLRLAYFLGVSPDVLVRYYKTHRS